MDRPDPALTSARSQPTSDAEVLPHATRSGTAATFEGGAANRRLTIRLLGFLVVVLAAMTVAACGEEELSESSTCKEFLAAEPADQQSITQQLAGKFGKPDYATPLGMPAVPYYCARHPDTTLQEFFEAAG